MSTDAFGTRDEADRFLDGQSSVTAAKWPTVGFVVEGDILGWEGPVQQTDMNSGELQYFQAKKKLKESELKGDPSKARPAMEFRIDLQCEATGITWRTNQYIEEAVPDDDGMRRMYVSGELQKAIGKGKEEAGEKYKLGGRAPLERMAHVKITRTKGRKYGNYSGFTYVCEWTPAAHNPAAAKQADDFLADDPWAAEE